MMEEQSCRPLHVSHPPSPMPPRRQDRLKRCVVTPPHYRQTSGYDHQRLLRETNLHLLSQPHVQWTQDLAWLGRTRLSSHSRRPTGPLAARMSRRTPYEPRPEALIHDLLHFFAHSYHLLRPWKEVLFPHPTSKVTWLARLAQGECDEFQLPPYQMQTCPYNLFQDNALQDTSSDSSCTAMGLWTGTM